MKKFLFIILICSFLLTGCNNQNKENLEKEKFLTEIDYFSNTIANMLNNLNNISLNNYELVSDKVSSNNSDEGGSNQSSSGSSSSHGGDKESQSSSQGEEQGEKSSQSQSNITITEMRNNSVLNTDSEKVDWDFMRKEIENMNNSWNLYFLQYF